MREANKYFIEQFILNETDNPNTWTHDEFLRKTRGNLIIGYLLHTKSGVKFGPETKLLNLYLIRPKYYHNEDKYIVSLEALCAAYNEFVTQKLESKFQNPPIQEWLETKENWCKKEADKIVQNWNWEFDDALSQVYFIVMKCYQKPHVYMGSLGYIQMAIVNSIKMDHRYQKNRLNGNNPNVISGDDTVYADNDAEGQDISLFDTIGVEDPYYAEQDAKQFEEDIRALMRNDFSEREIDQIFTQRSGYLPLGLYRRLLKFRKKHDIKALRALI